MLKKTSTLSDKDAVKSYKCFHKHVLVKAEQEIFASYPSYLLRIRALEKANAVI